MTMTKGGLAMTKQRTSLWQHRLSDFSEAVAHEPMPGCGATAVISADLGLSLVLKGLVLSQQHEARAPRQALIEEGESLKRRLAPLAQRDVEAFETFMAAVSRDKDDEDRRDAIHEAADTAVNVPLETARLCDAALALAHQAGDHIEAQFVSDAVAGTRLMHAALHGVLLNVSANAGQLGSDVARDRALHARDGLAHRADALLATITAGATERA